eukprot:g48950.t1
MLFILTNCLPIVDPTWNTSFNFPASTVVAGSIVVVQNADWSPDRSPLPIFCHWGVRQFAVSCPAEKSTRSSDSNQKAHLFP